MKRYEGKIKTTFFWILPLLIGVSKNNISNEANVSKANVYALHITPFLEIGFNWRSK
jgi:hypothetical protein